MPPLNELEKFVEQSLPPLIEPHHEPVLESGGSSEEQRQRAIKKQLAKLRLK